MRQLRSVRTLLFAAAVPAFGQEPTPPAPLPPVPLPPALDRVLRDYERAWQIAADMDNSNRGRMAAPTPSPTAEPVTPPSPAE
jgi:hypothetical protein